MSAFPLIKNRFIPDSEIALAKLAVDVLARANHTGQQSVSTLSDFETEVNDLITAAIANVPKDNDLIARMRLSLTGSQLGSGVSSSQQSLTIESGDAIFIECSNDASKSGLYTATVASGTATFARHAQADSAEEVVFGLTIRVASGTSAGYTYILTTRGSITLDTTNLSFTGYEPVGSGPTEVHEEEPTGDLDGVNVTYELAHAPDAGTLKLYLNGFRLRAGAGNDYTLSGDTITLATAPASNESLLADYKYS